MKFALRASQRMNNLVLQMHPQEVITGMGKEVTLKGSDRPQLQLTMISAQALHQILRAHWAGQRVSCGASEGFKKAPVFHESVNLVFWMPLDRNSKGAIREL